jgi:hypothetical protein
MLQRGLGTGRWIRREFAISTGWAVRRSEICRGSYAAVPIEAVGKVTTAGCLVAEFDLEQPSAGPGPRVFVEFLLEEHASHLTFEPDESFLAFRQQCSGEHGARNAPKWGRDSA